MCALARPPRPTKRAAVAFASGAKEAPVAAQPPAPADKKPAAVCRPIAGPTGVPGPTVPAIRRPDGASHLPHGHCFGDCGDGEGRSWPPL
jgi:hypothetical protein